MLGPASRKVRRRSTGPLGRISGRRHFALTLSRHYHKAPDPGSFVFLSKPFQFTQLILERTPRNGWPLWEVAFGASATHLAQILRVSRPMIYHYRNGMEPSAENKRRLQALAEFTNDWISQLDHSFEADLKTVQPEGRSLLDYLSDSELDFVALRRVINRNLEGRRRDRALRNQLADELTREETIEARQDIVRDRHVSGKPVYVGDPDNPGKLIQMLPNGRRIRGQMVNRQFVPDEK